MNSLSKNMKRSSLDIRALLGPLKRLKLIPKRSKKPKLIVDNPPVEEQVGASPAEVAPAEATGPIWTQSLFNLPNELLEHIFFLLHPLEVVKCRQLCSHLKHLIDNSIELQLRIDLAIDGYLLGYRGTDPAKDLRGFQEKRRKALESMKYVTSWEEPITVGDYGHFEVCDGIFAQIFTDDPAGKVFKTLSYKELVPPQTRRKRWTRTWDDLGMVFTDFSFWTQGDLQAIMEPRDNNTSRRIHFRTISSNESHPKSAAPYIDMFKEDCSIWTHCYSVSYEDRVIYSFWETEGAPRSGAGLVLDCTEAKIIMPYMPLADVAFLSRDEALVLFNGEGDHGTSIAVYSFPLQRFICECQLPFTNNPFHSSFLTRPESRFGDNCPSSIAKYLLPDPELNIVGMTFRVEEHARFSVAVILSVQRFRNIYSSLLKNHPGRTRFEWEEWGPTVTRWLPYETISSTGYRNIFGSRILVWGWPDSICRNADKRSALLLLDFNPRPIKRGDASTKLEGQSHEMLIEAETTMLLPNCKKAIKSSLPYRAFTTPWLPRCFSFRFDGNTIIGKGQQEYQFYSFLPLEPDEEQSKSGEAAEAS